MCVHSAEPNAQQRPLSLEDSLGVRDSRFVPVLESFGLDATCAYLVTWLPAIELAWIGGLSAAERRHLIDDIQARHASLSARGHDLVTAWLRRRPAQPLFRAARHVVRAQLAALPAHDRPVLRARIIGRCMDVAEAPSGLLCRRAVTKEEQEWLEALADALRLPDDPPFRTIRGAA